MKLYKGERHGWLCLAMLPVSCLVVSCLQPGDHVIAAAEQKHWSEDVQWTVRCHRNHLVDFGIVEINLEQRPMALHVYGADSLPMPCEISDEKSEERSGAFEGLED